MGEYLKRLCAAEILPHVDQPPAERQAFADEVMERFANPHIRHLLADIALNTVAKFKTRCLPSLLDHYAAHDSAPQHLALALAGVLRLYMPENIENGVLSSKSETGRYSFRDDPGILDWFSRKWSQAEDGGMEGLQKLCAAFLKNEAFWGEDLGLKPGLADAVCAHLNTIMKGGVSAALAKIIDQ